MAVVTCVPSAMNAWPLLGAGEMRSFPTYSHFCGYFLPREHMGLEELAHKGNVLSGQA